MAMSYSASVADAVEEVWSAAMQKPLFKSLVGKEVAAMELGDYTKGDAYHKPYRKRLSGGDYVDHNDVTIEAEDVTDEQLYIDTRKYVAFDSDKTNEALSRYDFIAPRAEDAAYKLKDYIDQDIFAEATNASDSIASDDIETGGVAADGVGASGGWSNSMIRDVFSLARKKLREANVTEAGDWFAVVDPGAAQAIEEYAMDNGFQVTDTTLKNGYAGPFMGFDVYVSNNLTESSNSTTTNTKNYTNCIIGKKNSITVATNTAPKMEIKDKPKQIGSNFIAWTVYGIKTFSKDSIRFLDAKLATDA